MLRPSGGKGSLSSVKQQQLQLLNQQKWNSQSSSAQQQLRQHQIVLKSVPQSANHDDNGIDIVAEALNSLSMEDRNKVLDDLHGVVSYNDGGENPTKIENCLNELDIEITKLCQADTYDYTTSQATIATVSTAAYKQAISTPVGDSYVSSKEFKLMFLRCDDWDVCKAAKRLVGFMESKLNLFGPDLLVKDITLADFLSTSTDKQNKINDEATLLETFVAGWNQIVPLQDRSNRHVSIINPNKLPRHSTITNVVSARACVCTSMPVERGMCGMM